MLERSEVGHLQETPVYDQTPEVLTSLGMDAGAAATYVEEHKRTYKPKTERSVTPMVTIPADAQAKSGSFA